MSSQAAAGTGLTPVMCYFPWFPYYLRYQIGFDILANPTDAQANCSVAGPHPHLIHVRLYFPDGFFCNPAGFSGMPHLHSFRGGEPHFMPPRPHFHTPMCQWYRYMYAMSHFYHQVQMGFQRSMPRERQHHARVMVYVVNGQPGESMVIDDVPYNVTPLCRECTEFHRDPEHIHNRPQEVPKRKSSQQSHKQSGHFCQQPSASGTSGQKGTSRAAPRKASGRVGTDRKSQQKKEDKPNFTQQMPHYLRHGSYEGMLVIPGKTFIAKADMPSVVAITEAIRRLDMRGQNNDGNVAQDMPSAGTITEAISHLDMGGQNNGGNVAQDMSSAATITEAISNLNMGGQNNDGNVAQDMSSAATITEAISHLDMGGQNNDGNVAQDMSSAATITEAISNLNMGGQNNDGYVAQDMSSAATITEAISHLNMGGQNNYGNVAQDMPSAATITEAISHLDMGGQNNDGNVAQDMPSAATITETISHLDN